MSVTRFAIEKNRITTILLLLVIGAGIGTFKNIPQQEDPGFIIRTAMISTYFPGASPERVENLVTDPIEEVIQELPELDFVNSTSRAGASFVAVNIKESYKEMRPIFDNLRRKVSAVRSNLPSEVIGPFVNDEFGEVFGIVLTVTGEGYTYSELKDVGDQVRDALLRVPDVAKVQIYGAQEERIFVEYNNARLAQLGISPQQLQQIVQSQNILYPGGKITTGDERIILEPTGNYESLDELKKSVISVPGSPDVLFLEDIANITRGYIDPPQSMVHSTGIPALGLGVSLREGGDILEMGDNVLKTIDQLQQIYPIGIEFDVINFQPDDVRTKVNNFVSSLLQAVAIVIVVMLIALGIRTGLVVASLIPMTILLSIIVMNMFSITLNTISLAALIIALGMLVDNAIVMSESILVQIQEGKKPVNAAVESASELRVPLLTSSLTTAAAFLPIFLAESNTGEYTADLFKVVTIALLSSWVLALTMIPMLAVIFIKVKSNKQESYTNSIYRTYRSTLIWMLKHRWISVGIVVLLFFGAMQLSRFIPSLFFPKSNMPSMYVELEFPMGTPIERTEQMVNDLEEFFLDSLMVTEERTAGMHSWASFIGSSTPRYYLSAASPNPEEGLATFIINTTGRDFIDATVPRIEKFLVEKYPDLKTVLTPRDLGPPVMAPVQIRVYGEEEDELFRRADEVKQLMAAIEGTKTISDDWGSRTKKLVVRIDQPRARRAGVSSFDIATSLQTILSGVSLTDYRENENLIPIIMRADAADRDELAKLETMDVFSQSTGMTVPLKQVADIELEWQPSRILRRNRTKMVTVSCYHEPDLVAMDIYNKLMPELDRKAASWPMGYYHEYGGELESSVKAQSSIGAKLPLGFGIIILLLVSQFNSIRRAIIILLSIPLALIGVNIGLVLLNGQNGFMTFLGIISLAGIVINNAIVLLDRIKIEIEEHGVDPRHAVVVAAQKRFRPILLTTATTIGGLLPLYFGGDPMWVSMAIAIIFGLLFSTTLTLGIIPVFYALFFKVRFNDYKYSA